MQNRQEIKEEKNDSLALIPKKLYLYNLNASNDSIFKNVIIDEHSLHLLKIGKADQRYAVVGWIDENENQIHLHFRPSFKGPSTPNETEEQKKERLSAYKIARSCFNESDIVEAPYGITGLVHQNAIASVRQYYREHSKNAPYLYTAKKIGLSFYKRSDHVLEWVNRSTLNTELFYVNELAKYCFYFESETNSFKRPQYTNALHLARSLQTQAFTNLMDNTLTQILHNSKLSEITKEEKQLYNQTQGDINHECKNRIEEYLWEEILNGESPIETIAILLMRTIFIASGLENSVKPQNWPQDENWVVIKNTLEIAKKYKIKLDLEYCPSPSEFPNLSHHSTALINAANNNDMKSVEYLVNAGANRNACNDLNHTPLIAAICNHNITMISYLLDKEIKLENKDQIIQLLISPEVTNILLNRPYSFDIIDFINAYNTIKQNNLVIDPFILDALTNSSSPRDELVKNIILTCGKLKEYKLDHDEYIMCQARSCYFKDLPINRILAVIAKLKQNNLEEDPLIRNSILDQAELQDEIISAIIKLKKLEIDKYLDIKNMVLKNPSIIQNIIYIYNKIPSEHRDNVGFIASIVNVPISLLDSIIAAFVKLYQFKLENEFHNALSINVGYVAIIIEIDAELKKHNLPNCIHHDLNIFLESRMNISDLISFIKHISLEDKVLQDNVIRNIFAIINKYHVILNIEYDASYKTLIHDAAIRCDRNAVNMILNNLLIPNSSLSSMFVGLYSLTDDIIDKIMKLKTVNCENFSLVQAALFDSYFDIDRFVEEVTKITKANITLDSFIIEALIKDMGTSIRIVDDIILNFNQLKEYKLEDNIFLRQCATKYSFLTLPINKILTELDMLNKNEVENYQPVRDFLMNKLLSNIDKLMKSGLDKYPNFKELALKNPSLVEDLILIFKKIPDEIRENNDLLANSHVVTLLRLYNANLGDFNIAITANAENTDLLIDIVAELKKHSFSNEMYKAIQERFSRKEILPTIVQILGYSSMGSEPKHSLIQKLYNIIETYHVSDNKEYQSYLNTLIISMAKKNKPEAIINCIKPLISLENYTQFVQLLIDNNNLPKDILTRLLKLKNLKIKNELSVQKALFKEWFDVDAFVNAVKNLEENNVRLDSIIISSLLKTSSANETLVLTKRIIHFYSQLKEQKLDNKIEIQEWASFTKYNIDINDVVSNLSKLAQYNLNNYSDIRSKAIISSPSRFEAILSALIKLKQSENEEFFQDVMNRQLIMETPEKVDQLISEFINNRLRKIFSFYMQGKQENMLDFCHSKAWPIKDELLSLCLNEPKESCLMPLLLATQSSSTLILQAVNTPIIKEKLTIEFINYVKTLLPEEQKKCIHRVYMQQNCLGSLLYLNNLQQSLFTSPTTYINQIKNTFLWEEKSILSSKNKNSLD